MTTYLLTGHSLTSLTRSLTGPWRARLAMRLVHARCAGLPSAWKEASSSTTLLPCWTAFLERTSFRQTASPTCLCGPMLKMALFSSQSADLFIANKVDHAGEHALIRQLMEIADSRPILETVATEVERRGGFGEVPKRGLGSGVTPSTGARAENKTTGRESPGHA